MPYSLSEVIAEIVSLPGYESRVSALLGEEERAAMESSSLALQRIIRSFRGREVFAKSGGLDAAQGKSGGFRAIYFFVAETPLIYMALIYAKSRKETLSAADQNGLAMLAAQIKRTAKGGRS